MTVSKFRNSQQNGMVPMNSYALYAPKSQSYIFSPQSYMKHQGEPKSCFMEVVAATVGGASGVPVAAAAAAVGKRAWQGVLICGNNNVTAVRAIAIQIAAANRLGVTDASSWPNLLHLDTRGTCPGKSVIKYLTAPQTQWYVRFAAIDPTGSEVADSRLQSVAREMAHGETVLELPMMRGGVLHSNLYVLAVTVAPGSHVLVGAVLPDSSSLKPESPLPPPDSSALRIEQMSLSRLSPCDKMDCKAMWSGILRFRGLDVDMDVPVVALRHKFFGRPTIRNTSSWPPVLECDTSAVRPWIFLSHKANDSGSQWYVRFISAEAGTLVQVADYNLGHVIHSLRHASHAFELEFNGGKLFLFPCPPNPFFPSTFSLAGVFRPDPFAKSRSSVHAQTY